MLTSRVSSRSTVVSSHPKVSLIVPILGLDEVRINLDVVAHEGLMFVTVANSTISAGVRKGEVRLILLA